MRAPQVTLAKRASGMLNIVTGVPTPHASSGNVEVTGMEHASLLVARGDLQPFRVCVSGERLSRCHRA